MYRATPGSNIHAVHDWEFASALFSSVRTAAVLAKVLDDVLVDASNTPGPWPRPWSIGTILGVPILGRGLGDAVHPGVGAPNVTDLTLEP